MAGATMMNGTDSTNSTNNTIGSSVSLLQLRQRAFSAIFGSTLVSLTVTPLDVVKVRMQAQPGDMVFCGHWFDRLKPCHLCSADTGLQFGQRVRITGTVDGIVTILRREGVQALYRGFAPTLLMAVPANVLYFVAYESLRDALTYHDNNDHNFMPPAFIPTVSGGVARVFAAAVVSPLELLKTRMQHQNHSIVRQLADLSSIVRLSGVSVLFRGLMPTLWRDVPFSAIYWTMYELLKKTLTRHDHDDLSALRQFCNSFFAGSVAGSMAAVLTIPFDVVKTRQQVDMGMGMMSSGSLLTHLRHIYTVEGWRGVTRGVVPRVGKVAPACAIMISSYELGKRFFPV